MQVMPLKTQQFRSREARFRWRLILVTILLNVLCYAAMMLVLGQSWRHYRDSAETSAQNIAKKLEKSIAHTLDILDTNLLAAKAEIERQQANGGIKEAELNALANRWHTHLPAMNSILVVNANGVIMHSNGKTAAPATPVDNREYFQFLRDNPPAGLHISKPLLERNSGDWILILSRRFNHPDGSFAGILNDTVSLSHFQQLFSSLELGSQGVVALQNDEFGIITHPSKRPGTEPKVTSKTTSPEWQRFLRSGRPDMLFTAPSSIDSVTRTTAVHKIARFPLYVVVGLALDDYFADWWQAVGSTSEGLLLFTLVTVLLSLLFYHYWLNRLSFIANSCSIRSRPCRLTGFGNRMSIPASSRFRPTWRRNTEAVPKTSQTRRAGMLASTKVRMNGSFTG